jgi:SAM-dependent methyltransferase
MDFYQSISAHYDLIFPVDPQTVDFIGGRAKPGSRILDIACGTGGYSLALAEKGHRLMGIDLDQSMIRILAKGITRLPTLRDESVGLEFVRTYELDPAASVVIFRTELRIGKEADKSVVRNQVPLRILGSQDLLGLAASAGFQGLELFGGFDEEPFGIDTLPLVLCGYKS